MEPKFRLVVFSPGSCALVHRKGGSFFRIIFSQVDKVTTLDIEMEDLDNVVGVMNELMTEEYPERHDEKMANVVTGEELDLGGDK